MTAIVSRLPTALSKNLPVIREVDAPPPVKMLVARGQLQAGTRYFRMGKAKIMLSPPTQHMGWHMSISRDDRYPDWDEVVAAWYSLVPDAEKREGMMYLPPMDEYVNVHEHCFQVHELIEAEE